MGLNDDKRDAGSDIAGIMRKEEAVTKKVDSKGNRWEKAYFGSGSHFKNWLEQFKEIYGKENVEVEDVNSSGFKCYDEDNEKMKRIWIKL